ncbi:MAG: CYTH domain-containing protein [Muribaculaceae bacterium]|nr:CYTH domain-containing protein [Muribaculaceae bacterium]
MATEIEHKYLVKNDSFVARATQVIHIRQGYLAHRRGCTVRVRVADDRAYITIKGPGNGLARPEFEYEIPLADGLQLLEMSQDHIVVKDRHIVIDQGNRWEVDIYHGPLEGLMTAELEVPTEDYAYPLPDFVGQDVTGDSSYSNASLSRLERWV